MAQRTAPPGRAERSWVWNPRVASRTLEEQAFILLDGRLLSLNPSGTFLWDRLKEGAREDDLVEALLETFDVDPGRARADVRDWMETLRARNLVVPSDAHQEGE